MNKKEILDKVNKLITMHKNGKLGATILPFGASVVVIYNFLPIIKEYILSSIVSNNIPRF